MNYTNQDIEKRLRAETKNITPDLLQRVKYANIEELEIEKSIYKKRPFRLIMSLVTVFVLLFVMTNVVIYGQVYETLTIDVNPSIEIEINRYNRVINVNYNNSEAYDILKEVKLKNLTVERAIGICYDRLYDENFLNSEDNIIILSGYNKNKTFNQNKLAKYSLIIEQKAKDKNVNSQVETNDVTKDDVEQAKDHNISFGKLKIINLILNESDSYTFAELKVMNMKDLKNILINIRKN